tara:strand:+ start:40095 stop:40391 length:297 start_codon:yes stop_codon:yes gene_type:complete
MIIVLPYTATDNCSYFIPTHLFFEEVDIETAYIKIEEKVKKYLEDNKLDFNSVNDDHSININNEYIPLSTFFDLQGINIPLITIDDFLKYCKKDKLIM